MLSLLGSAPAVPSPAPSAAPPLALAPIPAPAPARVDEPEPPPPRPRIGTAADQAAALRIAALPQLQHDQSLCAFDAAADPDVTMGLLERSPQRFNGHLWSFRGRAIQVEDVPDSDATFLLVSLDSYGNDIVAVIAYARPPDNVVADRRVHVYGRIDGTYSYETRNGQQRTVPRVFARAVIKNDEAPRCRR